MISCDSALCVLLCPARRPRGLSLPRAPGRPRRSPGHGRKRAHRPRRPRGAYSSLPALIPPPQQLRRPGIASAGGPGEDRAGCRWKGEAVREAGCLPRRLIPAPAGSARRSAPAARRSHLLPPGAPSGLPGLCGAAGPALAPAWGGGGRWHWSPAWGGC